jgi:hypothetical protein
MVNGLPYRGFELTIKYIIDSSEGRGICDLEEALAR